MNSLGEDYFNSLNLKVAKNIGDLRAIITDKVSGEVADHFIDMIRNRGVHAAEGTDLGERAFYDFKNADYKRGITISAAHDGDIMIKTCDWVHERRKAFGKTILDVGCDTGIVSCFLAKEFPDSNITAIDDGQPAIDIAKELAHKLNLTNIEFVCRSVKDETGTFDTVFSSRTLHENLSLSKFRNFAPYREKCMIAAAATKEYVDLLTSRINDGGALVSVWM